jgi:hypothetical protein
MNISRLTYKWILLLLLIQGCGGTKTTFVLGFWKDLAIERHDPWVTDSRATVEFRAERDWK